MTDISPKKFLLNILIVEDEIINQLILKKALENLGCNVRVAQDGNEAIKLLQENYFELVFMDIQIPFIDGLEVTKRLRLGKTGKLNKNTPVFAYTALAGTVDKKVYMEAGMGGCLTKPFHLEDVVSLLNMEVLV
ncbi:response regulator [Maridesulfovibrio sp.]|uniref:response regulator n=1 Tax=unclassified Maridesulfovibrio TaxID=2794999 RepID=UPI003B005943